MKFNPNNASNNADRFPKNAKPLPAHTNIRAAKGIGANKACGSKGGMRRQGSKR